MELLDTRDAAQNRPVWKLLALALIVADTDIRSDLTGCIIVQSFASSDLGFAQTDRHTQVDSMKTSPAQVIRVSYHHNRHHVHLLTSWQSAT